MRVTSVKNFRQADTRWGKLGYKKAPYYMSNAGCGATATADVIVSNPKYKSITPKNTRSWLLKYNYVVNGQGTAWDGIPAVLKAYGFIVKDQPTMNDLFKLLAKGKVRAVILMTKGTKGGVTWTTTGHFLAVSGYKTKNGKHYLYMNDPGGRHHDGWYCYEDTMKGLCRKIWSAYLPTTKLTTDTKTTAESKEKKGFDISYAQKNITADGYKKALKQGYDFAILRVGTILSGAYYTDAEFESKYKNAISAKMKVGVYWYGMAKDEKTAKNEANYVLEVLKKRHLDYPVFYDIEDKAQSGLSKAKNKAICEAFCKVIEDAGYKAGVYASMNWLTNKIDTISSKYSVWVAQYNSTCTYKGRYEIWQYSSTTKVDGVGSKIDVNKSTLAYGNYPTAKTTTTTTKTTTKKTTKKTRVYPELPKRGFFKMGDKGVNVKRLQTLLKKAGYNVGALDGIYGNKTATAVRAFQKKQKITVDGCWGKQSQNALKKVLK